MPARAWRQPVITVALVLALVGCGSPATEPTPSPTNGPDPATYRYTCWGPAGFLPTLLEQPGTAETEDHPSAQGLREFLAEDSLGLGILPDAGWWLVSRSETEAEYVARLPEVLGSPFGYVVMGSGGAGWTFISGGDCLPEVVLDGRVPAVWAFRPDRPRPGPTTREFAVLATDMGCTGGQAVGARLLPPDITYTQESVFIVFSARRPHQGLSTCQGKPPTAALVRLREPLGDRNLLDAGVFPPADPTRPLP